MSRAVSVERLRDGARERMLDAAAVEEPLQVRVDREPFAVLMRTPGDDCHLTAGFLVSERIVSHPADVASIEPCVDSSHPDRSNVIDVALAPGARVAAEGRLADRRKVVANASCGLCGRVTVESLQVEAPYVGASWTLARERAATLPSRLRVRQAAFEETGGLHAAGVFSADGTCDAIAEDIGRHNAVDKVVGRLFLAARLPCPDRALVVSGRASFEIVQKAFLAGIPIIAAVSAPSSLAIDLAEAAGITLLGFVRDGGFNVYTHGHRIVE
ncbi:MAG: formate dehydrogenase accessory sulfurtransferase FdhD [Vicinamibacterales bacterium]